MKQTQNQCIHACAYVYIKGHICNPTSYDHDGDADGSAGDMSDVTPSALVTPLGMQWPWPTTSDTQSADWGRVIFHDCKSQAGASPE
jgi:hypothetical protein